MYTIMTNEQLAEMVRLGVTTPEELRKISGIGGARIGKYGADVVAVLAEGVRKEENNVATAKT